jgi:hypothetical protein
MIVFGSMNGPRRQTIVCDKVYPCMIAILNLPAIQVSNDKTSRKGMKAIVFLFGESSL